MGPSSKRPPGAGIFSVLALVAALVCGVTVVRAADGERVPFNIEAGSAAVRLNEWATASGFSVVSDYETTARLRTQAVSGLYEPIEALKIMIAPTGLKYSFVNKKFVTLWLPGDQRAGPAKAPAPPPRKPVRSAHVEEPLRPVETITITGTGTHIRDTPWIGSPLQTLRREDLETAGAATVIEPIRTLPQVFGGGPSEDTEIGTEARSNSGRGVGVNLRGADASSSLVLLNSHRIAPGGSEGLFIDITSIPLIAVNQIDIMSDGASALYGADAVGGVVNFSMLENVSRNETQLRAGGLGGGAPGDLQLGQLFGRQWDGGNGLMAFEYYNRDPLPASERAQATNDLRQFGGGDFRTFSSNPGTIVFGPMTWGIPQGQDGTNLTSADLIPGAQYHSDRLAYTDILPEQERWSAYGNLRQALNENVDLFADALFTERQAIGRTAAVSTPIPVTEANPFYVNPLGPGAPNFPITVMYNFIADLGPVVGDATVSTLNGVVGLDSGLGATWNVTASAGYALEEQRQSVSNGVDFGALQAALLDPDRQTAFNPFGDGSHTNRATLEAIRSNFSLRTHSRVGSVNLIASGPVLALPGGFAKLALGTDLRSQSFEATVTAGRAPANQVRNDRDVLAVFGELHVPLVGELNARRGLRKLELSLAARLEDYSDFGRTTTPRIGVAWSPVSAVSLRSTWAESLRAPSLYDLNEINNVVTFVPLPDPTAPGGLSPALVWSGKNAALREERAASWTLGADFKPAWLPDFSLALTYFDLKFRDRIQSLSVLAFDFLNDPRVAELVTLDPTLAEREAVCQRAAFSASALGPCASVPVAAIVDLRLRNGAYMRTNGIDLLAKYARDTSLGSFKFTLLGTYVLDYSEASLLTLPVESYEGTQNYPNELRLRGSTTWKRRQFSATGAFNYANSYRDMRSVPNRRVSSWTTLDLNLAYSLGNDDSGTRFSMNVENVFNDLPPFLNNSIGRLGYDAENADLTGRIVSFRVRKNW